MVCHKKELDNSLCAVSYNKILIEIMKNRKSFSEKFVERLNQRVNKRMGKDVLKLRQVVAVLTH